MSMYSIRAPNGKLYTVEGPDGATRAQIIDRIMQAHPEAGTPPVPQTEAQRASGIAASEPWYDQALLGIGKASLETMPAWMRHKLGLQLGDTAIQGGATSTVPGELGYLGDEALQFAATQGAAGAALKGAGIAGKALRYGSAALGGSVLGAEQAQGSPGEKAKAAILAGGLSALGEGLPSLLSKPAHFLGARAKNALRLLSQSGRARLALMKLEETARSAGQTPEDMAKSLLEYPRPVEGYLPTTAQANPSAEILDREAAIRKASQGRLKFIHASEAQDRAVIAELRKIAGLDHAEGAPDPLQQAIAKRRAAFAAVDHKLSTQRVDPQPLLDEIDHVLSKKGGSDAVSKVLRGVKLKIARAQAENFKLFKRSGIREDIAAQLSKRVLGSFLQDVRRTIGENVHDALQRTRPINGSEKAAINHVRGAITETLDKEIPGFKDADAQYAKDSIPVNRMEMAREALTDVDKHGPNTAGEPHATEKDIERALARDSREMHGIHAPDRAKLEGIHKTLLNRKISENRIAGRQGENSGTLEALKLLRNPWVQRFIGAEAGGAALGSYEGGRKGGYKGALIGGLAGIGAGAAGDAAVERGLGDVASQEADLMANSKNAYSALARHSAEKISDFAKDAAAHAKLANAVRATSRVGLPTVFVPHDQKPLVVPIDVPENAPNPYVAPMGTH